MSQRQRDKHQTDNASKGAKTVVLLDSVASTPFHFAAPNDQNWMLRKQHPQASGVNKNRPAGPKPTWGTNTETLVPEDIKDFVDKHVVKVLEKTEEGRAFLKENPNGITPTD